MKISEENRLKFDSTPENLLNECRRGKTPYSVNLSGKRTELFLKCVGIFLRSDFFIPLFVYNVIKGDKNGNFRENCRLDKRLYVGIHSCVLACWSRILLFNQNKICAGSLLGRRLQKSFQQKSRTCPHPTDIVVICTAPSTTHNRRSR